MLELNGVDSPGRRETHARKASSSATAVAWLVAAIGLFTAVVALITGAGPVIAGTVLALALLVALGFAWGVRALRRGEPRASYVLISFTVLLAALVYGNWFMLAPLLVAIYSSMHAWRWQHDSGAVVAG